MKFSASLGLDSIRRYTDIVKKAFGGFFKKEIKEEQIKNPERSVEAEIRMVMEGGQMYAIIRVPDSEDIIDKIRPGLRECGLMYLVGMGKRFDELSGGGGEWPLLSKITLRKRRQRGIHHTKILYEEGTIRNVLTNKFGGIPGQLADDVPDGVRAGYGGGAIHRRSKMSIAEVAIAHQKGVGRLPIRRILVNPDQSTKDSMQDALAAAVRNYLLDSNK